jgi:hypothetical protein
VNIARTLTELSPSDLVDLTLALENRYAYDSIPTIKRQYAETEDGPFGCVFPECSYATRDAARMWRHVHGVGRGRHQPCAFTERMLVETVYWMAATPTTPDEWAKP